VETLRDPEVHDFLTDLLRRGWAAQIGASVVSLAEVEAALSIPAITILQMPVAVSRALSGRAAIEHVRGRKIGVLVRGVLADLPPDTGSLGEAMATALAPDFITSAIIGVSTRRHLDELLSALA
jgi:aryl-alcohol dehydrogenase-like predicted oxidoreductase